MNWVSDTARVLIEVRDIILSRVNKIFFSLGYLMSQYRDK